MSGILVITEQNAGAWHKMTWEALSAGQQLGQMLNQPVHACVFGNELEGLVAELSGCELASAVGLQHELLANYTADGVTAALEWLIERLKPAYVIFPHTYQVRDFGPKLATRRGRVLVSDVIAFRVAEGGVTLERQLFQGKLNADYVCDGSGPVFVSIQAGAFRPEGLVKGKAAESSTLAPPIDAASIRQQPEPPFRESARAVDLTAAELIVAVGRGIQEEGNIPLVRELAEALGAELAASRPICDNAWLPMDRQVGSSGQTVSPKMYLAVGISGAIQHLIGMKGSKCVVAINRDANAPIFEIADYGIAGDLFEVVPALTEAVKKARG